MTSTLCSSVPSLLASPFCYYVITFSSVSCLSLCVSSLSSQAVSSLRATTLTGSSVFLLTCLAENGALEISGKQQWEPREALHGYS